MVFLHESQCERPLIDSSFGNRSISTFKNDPIAHPKIKRKNNIIHLL